MVRSVCASRIDVQKLISKYGLAAHLAIAAVAPLFLSPIPVLWLSMMTAFWILLEPSRIGNEMLHNARARIITAIVKDPIFWVMIILMIVAAVRALNTGVAMVYDAENAKWSLGVPNLPLMPGSVEGCGFAIFALATAVMVTLIGARHALGRSARAATVLLMALLAGVGFGVEILIAKDVPNLFSAMVNPSFVSPSFRGSVAGIFSLAALVSLTDVFERRWWKALTFAVIALMLNATATFVLSPFPVIVLFLIAFIPVVLYSFVYLRIKMGNLTDFKYLVLLGIGLVLAVVCSMSILPDDLLMDKISPFEAMDMLLPDKFLEWRGALSDICFRVWRDRPWLGTGLGSFGLDLRFFATPQDWSVLSPLQSAPLNGYWLILAERGVVGAFLLVVPVVLLLISYIHRLVLGIRSLPHPICIATMVMIIVAAVEMLGDCSFLEPGAVIALTTLFVIGTNGFQKESK